MPERPKFDSQTLKRLLSYMRAYKGTLVLVTVCILLSAVAGAASSMFLQKLIDGYIVPMLGTASPDYSGLIRALITIGCVYERPQEVSMLVKGRDAKTGLPNEVMVSSMEMLEAFKRPARQIVDEVLDVLEHSSPELVADIAQNGIVLTGGGSLLYGFDKLIAERTQIACSIADDADSCVANGCGKSLQWISSMQEGTINLARRRLLKE